MEINNYTLKLLAELERIYLVLDFCWGVKGLEGDYNLVIDLKRSTFNKLGREMNKLNGRNRMELYLKIRNIKKG